MCVTIKAMNIELQDPTKLVPKSIHDRFKVGEETTLNFQNGQVRGASAQCAQWMIPAGPTAETELITRSSAHDHDRLGIDAVVVMGTRTPKLPSVGPQVTHAYAIRAARNHKALQLNSHS
jgi:hypothetical protein